MRTLEWMIRAMSVGALYTDPTCRLPQLAERLDAHAPELQERRVI